MQPFVSSSDELIGESVRISEDGKIKRQAETRTNWKQRPTNSEAKWLARILKINN